ncbi:MAG TPA: hypothetical protein VMF32_26425, partial [Xanthobacteraceae bacterium]|nr:hypothetical protein [Xanthobacteraceae bacterium]
MPAVTDESKNNKSALQLLKLANSKLAMATPLMPALVVSLPVAPISAGFQNVILESRANQLTSAGDGRENGAPTKTINYELAKELKDAVFRNNSGPAPCCAK